MGHYGAGGVDHGIVNDKVRVGEAGGCRGVGRLYGHGHTLLAAPVFT